MDSVNKIKSLLEELIETSEAAGLCMRAGAIDAACTCRDKANKLKEEIILIMKESCL